MQLFLLDQAWSPRILREAIDDCGCIFEEKILDLRLSNLKDPKSYDGSFDRIPSTPAGKVRQEVLLLGSESPCLEECPSVVDSSQSRKEAETFEESSSGDRHLSQCSCSLLSS